MLITGYMKNTVILEKGIRLSITAKATACADLEKIHLEVQNF